MAPLPHLFLCPLVFRFGSLLFLIYINGLTELSLSTFTHIILYADDICFNFSLFLIHLIWFPFNQTWVQFLFGFLLTFSKSILQNLSTFSFLTNPFLILTHSLLSQNNFICPFSQKSSFYHPCIPSAIRLCNFLPPPPPPFSQGPYLPLSFQLTSPKNGTIFH